MSSGQRARQQQDKNQGDDAGSTLRALRRAAGYRTGKELAEALGVPKTSYSRWERSPQGPDSRIPMRQAWAMADLLGCTIDDVVGREADGDGEGRRLLAAYRALSEGSRARLDEYLQFLSFRDRVIASQGR